LFLGKPESDAPESYFKIWTKNKKLTTEKIFQQL